MPATSPLAKRIKRHVIARPQRFFAATAPGFETLCLSELVQLQPVPGKAHETPGGVEFNGRLEACYQANLNLRTANRILMRIDAFRSSNFRQLEKKVGQTPWELYLHPGSPSKVHVTTKHCRLHHSGAISEKVQKSISHRLSGVERDPQYQRAALRHQNIYVRGIDDHFSVSIDSSGDLLYKRGLKKHTGSAPLRETLAAAALLLAGYNGTEPLLDPMCGTGTFSLEAALMVKRMPAGWFRDFAFTGWPSFMEKRWNYIRRQSESEFVQPEAPMIFASDNDPRACQKLESCLQKNSLEDSVHVRQIDFWDLDPIELTDQVGTICINPPYGRRLGGRANAEILFRAIGERLLQRYRGWKLVLLAPSQKLARTFPIQTKSYPVWHGGLKLRLLIGKIQ